MKKLILSSILVASGMVSYAQNTVNFKALLANDANKTINVSAILAEPKVAASPTPSTVTAFAISFKMKDGDLIGPFELTGNMLSDRELDVVKKLKAGDMIFIDNVTVSSGKEFKAASVNYVVE
ncbi:MAG: hypothetical protein JNL72_11380 [Flavipsychrobacter sp.]|nr:hypothetical protein [Flavipsychrobacter sp.]